MVSKNNIKYVHSLRLKKYRDAERVFVAEGPKVVADLLPLMPCRQLFATPAFLSRQNPQDWRGVEEVVEATDADIERLSSLRAPREVVAVFRQPLPETDDLAALAALPGAELCLALDSVQDPGNLGTIVRVAD